MRSSAALLSELLHDGAVSRVASGDSDGPAVGHGVAAAVALTSIGVGGLHVGIAAAVRLTSIGVAAATIAARA